MSRFPPEVTAEETYLGIVAKDAPNNKISRVNTKHAEAGLIHLHLVGQRNKAPVFPRDKLRLRFSSCSLSPASMYPVLPLVVTGGAFRMSFQNSPLSFSSS